MIATYRLQLGPDLDFADARALVPYLRRLGVSHLYLSPSLQARRGSTHGYDVVDPRRISEDLGGEGEFRRLAGAGLRVLLDVVPNHMAASDENPFWRDPALRERYFDIDARTGRHRRFFSIDDLAGVRVEDPEVFETTHALILGLVAEGVVDGLRVDHPDGLADPAGYLLRLRARGAQRVWVEKILEPGERLPDWPVEGTTGYEFMALATGLFVDPEGEAPLGELYATLTGERRPFAELADEAKRAEARTTFEPEVERLARLLPEEVGPEKVAEAVAGMGVYRTYIRGALPPGDPPYIRGAPPPGDPPSQNQGRTYIRGAAPPGDPPSQNQGRTYIRGAAPPGDPPNPTHVKEAEAGEVHPHDREALAEAELPEPVREALVEEPASAEEEEFVTRFQQTTGAVMAKGVEDTALYRYHRLVALNEVGGDPGRFAVAPEEMHAANLERAREHPRALLATQTHDTKRSGDVRARIAALASIPAEWRARVLAWRARHAPLRRGGAPDVNEEYLVYQTLVGAWPLERERLADYLRKALREAKVNTGWVEPDEAHERGVLAFCDDLYASAEFVAELEALVARVAPIGERAALGQTLLKLTAPGVGDVYQGDELWCLSLVDPDNRRPVDWGLRARVLDELLAGAAPTRETVKMHVVQRTLALRAAHPGAFAGGYRPLPAGRRAFAYARGDAVIAAMALVPGGEDAHVDVPPALTGTWRHAFTERDVEVGARAPLAHLLDGYPVALLDRA